MTTRFQALIRVPCLAALFLAVRPPTILVSQVQRTLAVSDLFAIRSVGDPQLSPDGQWVAYSVTTTSLEDEKSETRIWMVPAAGGDAIPMTSTGYSASRPRFSPDGKFLTFLASRGENAKTQVWALNRLGGEAQPLTEIEQGVSSYEWSPDGTRLLLTIRDPDEKADSTRKSKTQRPWVIDRLQFKRDGTGYLTGNQHTHLYVLDVKSKTLTQITSGQYDESDAVWSPDGKLVAFVSNRTADPDANSNTDIWIVAADNTDKGQTLRQVTANPGTDESPAFSPDGKQIAYVTSVEPDLIWYATNHLAVIPAAGGEPRILSRALDRNVSDPRFTPDGRAILFRLEDSAEDHLARIEVTSGRLTRLVSGPLAVRGFSQGPAGRLVALAARLDMPPEIFAVEVGGLRQITAVNKDLFSQLRLAEVKNVHFPSNDGTEIEGFIYLPPGYQPGLKYPTLLRIHGGPVSQFSHAFNFEAQLFAANGYVVVTVNPRGSSGYGQEFSRAIWADWGNKDYEDVMAGVDYAIAQGYADPDRLGVGGWSYGGILTNYVLTRTDRFKGAVTGASEVLYVANYGHDHYQLEWEKELGLPWERREIWERLSPFNAVTKIVTPTLIMGGEKDWNVPILNSEQLYQSLRRLGRVTQLVVYPGQSHSIRTPSYQQDRLERYLAWYDRFVKRPSSAASEGR
ncbi:MAG TPA: S9 family peptidase [Gemmatimonadales bacterium]|nr:S9 family peptidase [Gemmatimonadales bacterium]